MARLRSTLAGKGAGGLASLLGAVGKSVEPEPEKSKSSPFVELYDRLQSAAQVMVDGDFSPEAQREIDGLKGERDAAVQSAELSQTQNGALGGRVIDFATKLGWVEPPPSEAAGNPLHLAMMHVQNTCDSLRALGDECPAEDRREPMLHRITRSARLGIAANPAESAAMRDQLSAIYAEIKDFDGGTVVDKARAAGVAVTEAGKRQALLEQSVEQYKTQNEQRREQRASSVENLSALVRCANPESAIVTAEAVLERLVIALELPDSASYSELVRRMEIMASAFENFPDRFNWQASEPGEDQPTA